MEDEELVATSTQVQNPMKRGEHARLLTWSNSPTPVLLTLHLELLTIMLMEPNLLRLFRCPLLLVPGTGSTHSD